MNYKTKEGTREWLNESKCLQLSMNIVCRGNQMLLNWQLRLSEVSDVTLISPYAKFESERNLYILYTLQFGWFGFV